MIRWRAFFLLRVIGALVGLPTIYCYAADAHKIDYGSQGQCETDYAAVYVTVSYGPVHDLNPISIFNTLGVGVWTFTPTSLSGGVTTRTFANNYHTPTTGFGASNIIQLTAGSQTGSSTFLYPATGGKMITGQMDNGGQGNHPPTCPTTTANNVEITYFVNATPRTSRIVGAVSSNCSTQHSLTLWVNGAIYQNLTTSIFATRTAPSIVTIDAQQSDTTIDWHAGQPWMLAIDGNTAVSGVFQWPCPVGNVYCSGNSTAVTWQLPPSAGRTDATVVFDCAPPSGNLNLQGDLTVLPHSGSHTLSVKVNGVTKGFSTVAQVNAATVQHVLISTVVADFESGQQVEWFVDGVSQGSHPVTLTQGNCGGDPPVVCWAGEDRFQGTASGTTPPTPTPGVSPTIPPKPTPVPFTPPPGGTPGPPPHTSPPPSGGTPTNSHVENAEDFYEPVRRAVRDSGSDTSVTVPGIGGPGTLGELTLEPGKMDEVTAATTNIKDKGNDIVADIYGASDTAHEKLSALTPNGIGQTGVVTVPITGWFATHLGTTEFKVDFTKFSTGINLFRTLVSWILYVTFFTLTVRALVYNS